MAEESAVDLAAVAGDKRAAVVAVDMMRSGSSQHVERGD